MDENACQGPKSPVVVGRLSVERIFNYLRKKKKHATFRFNGVGYEVLVKSARMKCFQKNRSCVVCGLIGTEMRVEREKNQLPGKGMLNLYGLNRHGHWVLLTLDHKIPVSKGGADYPDNYQTMCRTCNNAKKDSFLTVEELRDILGISPFVVAGVVGE